MSTFTSVSIKPGSVIKNRGRLWRVDAVVENEVLTTAIDGSEAVQHRFYAPLENMEEALLSPPSPEYISAPAANDLLLRAYRLSMLHGTAPLLSLQRSRVIPTNYQLVPVVMSLDMPRVRLLLADDVGLGKTIEAGLVITELLARQRASRVLVVCPANLREQWREALEYFFHIDARIISSRHRREMERELPAGANPWEYFRYLIVSIDYAKQPTEKHQIIEFDWDIVLIDEAHTCAKPHQSTTDQRPEMDRWSFAEAIADKANHFLLLTATPHNGYTDSYASLLNMLRIDAVSGPVHAPGIDRNKAAKYVCQRRRKDVEEWFKKSPGSKSPFPARN